MGAGRPWDPAMTDAPPGARPIIRATRRPRYVALAVTAFQQATAYRITTIFSILVNFFWVFILYFLWDAAFSESERIAGYSWAEMRTYIVLAYGINALVGWTIGSGMMQSVKSGAIVIDLVRPLNYCGTQLARAVGFSVVEGAISFVLTVLVGITIFDMQRPDSAVATAAFLVAVLAGYVTKVLVTFLFSLLCFWVLNSVGLMWAQMALINILSGTLIPLALMPDWLRIVANVLPLRGIVATPLALYLGKATGWEAAGLLALQGGWLVVLWVFANWAWKRAFRAVEIQGG